MDHNRLSCKKYPYQFGQMLYVGRNMVAQRPVVSLNQWFVQGKMPEIHVAVIAEVWLSNEKTKSNILTNIKNILNRWRSIDGNGWSCLVSGK